MATYIKTLKEDNGDVTYPQTVADAVRTTKGTTVQTELDQTVTAEDIAQTVTAEGSVTTNMIADEAVTVDKLADEAVTADKFDDFVYKPIASIVANGGETTVTVNIPEKYRTGCWNFRAEGMVGIYNINGTGYVKLAGVITGASFIMNHTRWSGASAVSIYNSATGYGGAEARFGANFGSAVLDVEFRQLTTTSGWTFIGKAAGTYNDSTPEQTLSGGKATKNTPLEGFSFSATNCSISQGSHITVYARKVA